MKIQLTTFILIFGLAATTLANAEVNRRQYAEDDIYITVFGEDWHPDGFEHGKPIPATYIQFAEITLDGKEDDPQWEKAKEVTVPLKFGNTSEVSIKALYTDTEVFFRVRWADDTENRDHYPWVWDAEKEEYVIGQQVEDSVILSFEAGCAWNPSLLAGYQYDFDGWRWMAARSDPVGQAWDLMGNIADQDNAHLKPTPYKSRYTENKWNVKFLEYDGEEISHQDWDELDRSYLYRPVRPMSYYRAEIDGLRVTELDAKIPAPTEAPEDETQTFPQFEAVKLEGDAADVSAKGHWQDGYWTVEFRRTLRTPTDVLTDSVFNRLTQFSVHVFDQSEKIDQSSESDRLFLEFLPEEPQIAKE